MVTCVQKETPTLPFCLETWKWHPGGPCSIFFLGVHDPGAPSLQGAQVCGACGRGLAEPKTWFNWLLFGLISEILSFGLGTVDIVNPSLE